MPVDFNFVQEAMKRVKEGDRVALKIMFQGSFVTLWGTLKSKSPTAMLVTEDGTMVAIRPIVLYNGRSYEFSSIEKG